MVLAIPMEEGKFCIEADTSEGAIGAVLLQEQDGKWHSIAFLSKALMVTEQNYEIYNKELLTIMLALDKWRHYLMEAAQDFEIWMDHQNLQYFWKPPEAKSMTSMLGNRTSRISFLSSPQNQVWQTRKLTCLVKEQTMNRAKMIMMKS